MKTQELSKLQTIFESTFPGDNRIAEAIDAIINNENLPRAAQIAGAASNQALLGRCFVGGRLISVYDGLQVNLWIYRKAACAAAAIEYYCMAAMPHNSAKSCELENQALLYCNAAIY